MKDIENTAYNASVSLREEDRRLKGTHVDPGTFNWLNKRSPLDFARSAVAMPGGIITNL